MPSLLRFLTTLAMLAALTYAGMFALATFVKPNKGEMSERVAVEPGNQPEIQ